MAKKLAVINDLSGFGKCSLTAAIPVISVMGVQACPLPTAILSAQTEYPSYYMDDYEDRMGFFVREWDKMNAHFDGIYTGFVSSEEQIDHIFDFLNVFYKEDTFLLVDPVMGDNGNTYDVFTDELQKKMKRLVTRADIITPNLTELCLLTDQDYESVSLLEKDQMIEKIREMANMLLDKENKIILVTGIVFRDGSGEEWIANLLVEKERNRLFSFKKIGGSFSGTGDLFASVLAGGIARGGDPAYLCELAGKFVQASMDDAIREGIPRNDGSEFERHLGMLLPDIGMK
ncbi:MAG: pyridoxamine kinase [Eubacteriales bacterium]|nr:pyridoxamine kinase [Eubacteriales bacterium]